MSGKRRIQIRIALTGILFLLLWAGTASAAGKQALRAACPSRSGETVTAREGRDGLVLSLPGFWDPAAVVLELEGSGCVYLGGEKLEAAAGEPADVSGLIGKKIKLRDDGNRTVGNLTILQGSAIPALFLEVDGEQLKQVNRDRNQSITEGRAVYAEADGTVAYDGPLAQLRGRGHNSFRYSKKPYQLKLEEKASLSGMGRGKTWVLLADWTDISLLRNRIVLGMSRQIGLRNAVDCVHADVWINGLYQGLYLLTEKIQIGKNRIPITDPEKAAEKAGNLPEDPGKLVTEKGGQAPLMRWYAGAGEAEDLTGGYIATIEKYHRMRDTRLAGFRTADGLSIRIKEPTYPGENQARWLEKRISEMQHALMAEDGIAPETGKDFREYLDVTSFALKYLIEEWSRNYDSQAGSQFIYKDSDAVDPLIYAGPAWDYDLSFGNMKDRGYPPSGRHVTFGGGNANLYRLLYRHEPFREKVSELWRGVFHPAAAVLLGEAEGDGGLLSLDAMRAEIEASANMNFARWGTNTAATARDAGGSFDRAVRYLKNWIAERTGWMDGTYGAEE